MQSKRRDFLKAGLGIGSLFLPFPCATVRAQSDGVIRLLLASKVALVLGNSAYRSVPTLRTPANDARAIAEVLKAFGFDVTLKLDGSRAEIEAAIEAYTRRLAASEAVGLVYYAGHGLQLSWTNFIVPVEATIRSAEDVRASCVDVSGLIQGIRKAANPMNIVILDACRENPFARDFRASSKGLTQMDAPHETLLAYSTAPGNVASDGDGENGLYTGILLQEIRTPATRVEDVFKRVRLRVRRMTGGAQVPWESTSLEEDFWFLPPQQVALVAQERARKESEERLRAEAEARRAAQAEAQRMAQADEERRRRAAARAQREREERESADTARNFKEELARWESIKSSPNAADFYDFLLERPSGFISEQAQFRLDQLEPPKALPQQSANGIQQLPSGVNRYALDDEFELEIVDRYTNQSRRQISRVTYADDTKAEFNGGEAVYDQMGGKLRDRFGTKTPSIQGVPADISLGKRWRSAFINTRPDGIGEEVYLDFRVVAIEDVTVPAGIFKAYRIDMEGLARYAGGSTILLGQIWVDPATMLAVRFDREYRSSNSGNMVEYSSTRLASVRRAPR